MKKFLIFSLFLALWSLPVRSQEIDYEQIERQHRFALYQGEGEAGLTLYDLYEKGLIHLKEPEITKQYSLGLIRQSAQDGDGSAALSLGHFYMRGQYVEKDYDLAHDWFLIAEEAGKPMAAYQLGGSYINGLHRNISHRKALRYFEKASEAGIARATRQIAIAYHTGIGRQKNIDRAIKYYQLAAKQGDTLAARDLDNINANGGY